MNITPIIEYFNNLRFSNFVLFLIDIKYPIIAKNIGNNAVPRLPCNIWNNIFMVKAITHNILSVLFSFFHKNPIKIGQKEKVKANTATM